jgi:hypothetical protein
MVCRSQGRVATDVAYVHVQCSLMVTLFICMCFWQVLSSTSGHNNGIHSSVVVFYGYFWLPVWPDIRQVVAAN